MTKLAILFPGQGSQYIGMAKKIVQNYKVAAQTFNDANDILKYDLRKLVFEGKMEELTHSTNAQPAIVTASYAFFKVYQEEFGIEPHYTAGHSLGEITALIAAGAIDFPDGLCFVRKRGEIMHQAHTQNKGNIAVIRGIPEETLEQEIKEIEGFVSIAAYNSPSQMLVAGEKKSLHSLGKKIRKLNGEFIPFSMIPMKVDAPFHSSLMQYLENEIKKELDIYEFHPMKWNVISNVTALPYKDHTEIKPYIALQLTKPVRWRQIISYMKQQGVNIALEIGPQYILKNFLLDSQINITSLSYDVENDVVKLKKTLGLDRESMLNQILYCLKSVTTTPNMGCWDKKEYSENVIQPFDRLKSIWSYYQKNKKEPSKNEVIESFTLLNQILSAKQISSYEQKKIIEKCNIPNYTV